MNFINSQREENHPYLQLLMLACYALAGLLIGSVLSLLGFYLIEGNTNFAGMASGDPAYLPVIKLAQVLTTGFLFILPPVLLARTEKTKFTRFYGFKRPETGLLLLVMAIMLCSMPLMEWIALANQKMVLPDLLKPVQDWMQEKEDAAMQMTVLLLKMNQLPDFLINMAMIALLPAIAEELLFRGAIQRSFYRMWGNPHAAIWISAFIFSAIHVQFFGFFPRLLLGAGFGYLYFWSGSLWYAMLAHFLNNGYAVCVAWYLQLHHLPLSEADKSSGFPWYGYIISLILTIVLLSRFNYKSKQSNGKQLG